MNWTLYCTLIQFTIFEIFTKVFRKGEELMGWHRTTAAVPVTGAVHLGPGYTSAPAPPPVALLWHKYIVTGLR